MCVAAPARQGVRSCCPDHSGSFWKRAPEIDTLVLATLLHLPRNFYPEGSFNDVPANVNFKLRLFDSQAQSFADLDALAGVVPNGIAAGLFWRWRRHKSEYSQSCRAALAGTHLSKKKHHLALEMAGFAGRLTNHNSAAGLSIFHIISSILSGEWRPRLQSVPSAVHLRSACRVEAARLLRGAQVLLITSLAEETSSLVAMWKRLPLEHRVVAFRKGAHCRGGEMA